jgi:carbamoyl-phosphate synthase large subunit
VNKALGPEMKSTGESILFIDDFKDDQFYNCTLEENVFE